MGIRHSSHLLPTSVPWTPAAVENYTQDRVKSIQRRIFTNDLRVIGRFNLFSVGGLVLYRVGRNRTLR